MHGSTKQTYRDTFQKELKAFMKNLISVFPEDRDMKLMSSSLNIAMMDDPEETIITRFHSILLPFEGYIDNRNEKFFYETSTLDIQGFQIFSKLHVYWESLTDENRKVVWDYIQVLFLLSKSFLVQNS